MGAPFDEGPTATKKPSTAAESVSRSCQSRPDDPRGALDVGQLITGFVLTFVLDGLLWAAFGIFELLVPLTTIGVTQLVVVGPLLLINSGSESRSSRRGILTCAIMVVLLNGACLVAAASASF